MGNLVWGGDCGNLVRGGDCGERGEGRGLWGIW